MRYAGFSKELGAFHCLSSEKERREGERSHEGYQSSPKELKGGNVAAENLPATD